MKHLKPRLHRIMLQLLTVAAIIYLYGWAALMLIVVLMLIEFLPLTKIDLIVNPSSQVFKTYPETKIKAHSYKAESIDDEQQWPDQLQIKVSRRGVRAMMTHGELIKIHFFIAGMIVRPCADPDCPTCRELTHIRKTIAEASKYSAENFINK